MGDFAAVVRRYMTMRKMSLRDTARAAGYSDHTLPSKVLNGHKPVTPFLAASLDTAFDGDGEIALASAPPYRGSRAARQIADDVAGYLGADSAPLPHPLAIDAASIH
jgi:hypothetical protein